MSDEKVVSQSRRLAIGRCFVMKSLCNRFNAVLADEAGGEVLEYALIAGLIIVAAIAVITSVGTKVLARWTSLNGSL
jgi:Flp pilus assembly pilin Flp